MLMQNLYQKKHLFLTSAMDCKDAIAIEASPLSTKDKKLIDKLVFSLKSFNVIPLDVLTSLILWPNSLFIYASHIFIKNIKPLCENSTWVWIFLSILSSI